MPRLCLTYAYYACATRETLVRFPSLQRHRLPDGVAGSLLAGAFSGLATACVSTPLDYVKVQAQLRATSPALLLRLSTARQLATGHGMNCVREGLFTAIYLGLYAQLRPQLGDPAAFSSVVMASASTGAAAWLVAFPADCIKSVQQAVPPIAGVRPLSPIEAARGLLRHGGWRAFYNGAGASTFRAMLVTSSRMVGYEWACAFLSP